MNFNPDIDDPVGIATAIMNVCKPMYIKTKLVPASIIAVNRDKKSIQWVPIMDVSKEKWPAAARDAVKLNDADYLVHLNEAWVSTYSKEEYAKGDHPMPSQAPNRREVILVEVGCKDGRHAVAMLEVSRRDDGTPYFKDDAEVQILPGGQSRTLAGAFDTIPSTSDTIQ